MQLVGLTSWNNNLIYRHLVHFSGFAAVGLLVWK